MNYRKPKHEKVHNVFSKLLLLSVVIAVVYGIVLYSNNIKLANDLAQTEKAIDRLDEEIANLKNRLYGMTDFQDFESVILELGLVREFNPAYLTLNDRLTYR